MWKNKTKVFFIGSWKHVRCRQILVLLLLYVQFPPFQFWLSLDVVSITNEHSQVVSVVKSSSEHKLFLIPNRKKFGPSIGPRWPIHCPSKAPTYRSIKIRRTRSKSDKLTACDHRKLQYFNAIFPVDIFVEEKRSKHTIIRHHISLSEKFRGFH